MPFLGKHPTFALLGALIGTGLAYPQPPLRATATFVATNATEFRWNVLFFWVICAVAVFEVFRHTRYRRILGLGGLGGMGYLSSGYAEYPTTELLNAQASLWASPLHLLMAGLLPMSLAMFFLLLSGGRHPTHRLSSGISLAAFGLAYLGLLWNFYQTSAEEGWAWDWIETGPCWVLGGVLVASHAWATSRAAMVLAYIAFLSLSRTALITSAHHLQSPLNNLGVDPTALPGGGQLQALGGLWGATEAWAVRSGPHTPTWVLATLWLAKSVAARLGSSDTQAPKGAPSTASQGAVYGLTIGTALATLEAAYAPIGALGGLLLLRTPPYVRSLHWSSLLFFLAGLAVVWYTCPGIAGQLSLIAHWGLERSATHPQGGGVGKYQAVAVAACWFAAQPRRRGGIPLCHKDVCPRMQFALRYPDLSKRWSRGQGLAGIAFNALNLLWSSGRFNRHMLTLIVRYAVSVTVPYFRPTSVFGFSLIIGMYAQMYSGFLLAIFYLPDPSFVIPTREDLFMEVWWFGYVYKAHVLGVDILFTLSYLHILKKFYIKNYTEGDLDGWFTGAYAFLVYHLVVFLGITLSTNHLGDVTIMIAANIFWSLFLRWHKVYAPFFSNKHLSTEQLTRFMVAHYISAWYYLYLVQTHVMFIHEMWDADSNRSTQLNTSTPKASWGWDALKKEVMSMFVLYKGIALLYFLMAHPDAKVVNYAFFEQWSEAEMEEINFFIVAPHWYFRAHMGLLTVCAHHYEGLAWFVAFYVLLCYTPHLYRFWNKNPRPTGAKADSVPTRHSLLQEFAYVGLFSSMLYVGGTLPCGRFYYENIEGFFGNSFLRLSYEYIYIYLGFLAHTIDAFERWYLASPVHKLLLGRLLVVLQVYTAKNSSAQLVKFLLSKLPRISLDPRDWYTYLLTQRDVWRERVQGWVRYFNTPQV